jgi:hypothetical protein
MSDIRRLAHVEKIVSLSPIEGADRIEVCEILGWQCVVKKGEFRVGDTVVYIEVDSIVPEKPEYEFFRERKFRVRTIKLRKQISQGLVLPLSVLPEGKRYKEGQDVTDILGVVKYDPQAIQELEESDIRMKNPIFKFMMRFTWFRKLFRKNKGGFPKWIVKTDEERIQNMPRILITEEGRPFEVTEKLDGQSVTYYLKRNKGRDLLKGKFEFGVCSRNNRLVKPDSSSWWTIAKELDIESVLKRLIDEEDHVILQGEILGTNVQGNKYKVSEYKFYAFNLIYPAGRMNYFDMCESLTPHNIECVPLLDRKFFLPSTIDEIVKYSTGKSQIRPDIWREGIVVRDYDKGISFKVINPEFLLKNGE